MVFKKRRMVDKDTEHDQANGKIPVRDKRRFSADGEYVADEELPAEPVRPASELALEAKLNTEIARREAAEAKLVGVQAKFEEAKAGLEAKLVGVQAKI